MDADCHLKSAGVDFMPVHAVHRRQTVFVMFLTLNTMLSEDLIEWPA